MVHFQRKGNLMCVSHPTSQKQMVWYHSITHQRGFLHFWVFIHTLHTHTYTFLICANESRRWKKAIFFLHLEDDSSVHRDTWGSLCGLRVTWGFIWAKLCVFLPCVSNLCVNVKSENSKKYIFCRVYSVVCVLFNSIFIVSFYFCCVIFLLYFIIYIM